MRRLMQRDPEKHDPYAAWRNREYGLFSISWLAMVMAGQIETVTVDSVFSWMERAGLGKAPLRLLPQAKDLEVPAPTAIHHATRLDTLMVCDTSQLFLTGVFSKMFG